VGNSMNPPSRTGPLTLPASATRKNN
jgi:hypothetical protein